MGAQLVRLAFVVGPRHELSSRAFRLLTWVALTALDGDSPPRYFGKRETSAVGLGLTVEDAPDPSDPNYAEIERVRSNAFKQVQKAFAELVAAGLVQRVGHARAGRTSVYTLHLGATGIARAEARGTSSVPLDRGTSSVPLELKHHDPEGDHHSPPQVDRLGPLRGTTTVRTGVPPRSPQGTSEEPLKNKSDDEPRLRRVPHVPTRSAVRDEVA